MSIIKIHTNKGVLLAHLFDEDCPETVKMFKFLVEKGFYNNLIFFKHIDNTFIQTGCPHNTGLGWMEWHIKTEINPNHVPRYGSLGLATVQEDRGSSQFLIILSGQLQSLKHICYFGHIDNQYFNILQNLKLNDTIESINFLT